MKTRRYQKGFVSLPMVTMVTIIMFVSLMALFRTTVQNQDAQSHIQLRSDFHQREDAFVRALLAVFPNTAAGCMQPGSSSATELYTWGAIFDQAIALAGATQTDDASKLSTLGLASARAANPGDGSTITVNPLVVISDATGAYTTAKVNSGTTKFYGALSDKYPVGLPVPMDATASTIMDDDCLYPLITSQKFYSTDGGGVLQASVEDYPRFNLMNYPDIRLPLVEAGKAFISKRNWWAFSVTFANAAVSGKTTRSVTKNYVLSVYEVPSQLPISGDARTIIGMHADGTPWDAVNKLRGAVYGESVQASGSFDWQGRDDALKPIAASRKGLSADTSATTSFNWFNADYNQMGALETWQAENNQQAGQMGTAGDSGRVGFVPILPDSDEEFYRQGSVGVGGAISPTVWDDYSIGANQCTVKGRVTSVVSTSGGDYTPSEVEVTCLNAAGDASLTMTLTGDLAKSTSDPSHYVYWPNYVEEATATPPLPPFQRRSIKDASDVTAAYALVFMPGRLNAWLASVFPGAAAISSSSASAPLNNKFYFEWDSATGVTTSNLSKTGLVIADPSSDLTEFAKGISIVSASQVLIESDFNIVKDPNRLLTYPTHPYPPLSVFAPDVFVGTRTDLQKLVIPYGQLGTLKSSRRDSNALFSPLDIKSFATNAVLPVNEIEMGDPADSTATGLAQLTHPSQLPPITLMNWLITLEELPDP